MIESSYFRRWFLEMKGYYLEKWLKACSVFYALFSSNLSVAQMIGDTTNTAYGRAIACPRAIRIFRLMTGHFAW